MESLKRKPYVIGLLASAMLLAFAVWRFALPSAAKTPRLEQQLPADTVAFVQVSNLRAQALNIIDSEAWRAFSRENQAASSLFMMAVNHTGALDASYALALLGVETGADGQVRPGFVMVAQFDNGGARRTFENRVLRFVREARENGVEPQTEQYDGVGISLYTKDERNAFAYAREGNTLLISNSALPVRRVLDVRSGKAPSLEANETFLRARSRTAGRDGMFGFLDGVALAKLVESAPAAMAQVEAAAFRQLFHGLGLRAVESVTLSSTFGDGRVVERVSIVAPQREGVLKTIADNPPTRGALLALVPEDALQAFDASVASAPQVFDEMLALANQTLAHNGKKNLGDALREFTDKTGIDFRGEIVGALDSEICVAQLASDAGRSGLLILNLKDETRFAETLEKIARQKNHAVTEREYDGVAIRQVAGEKGHALHYAFLNGNFVAGGEAFALERVLDTARSGRSLAASASYRAAIEGVKSDTQFVYYNSNADYLNRLGSTLTSRDYEFKVEGAGAFLRPSFAFGVARAGGFYVESRSPLGAFPRLLAAITTKLSTKKKQGE